MKITIIPGDQVVGVDGGFERFAFSAAPEIHAVQWDTVAAAGEIEFNDGRPNRAISDFAAFQPILDARDAAIQASAPSQAQQLATLRQAKIGAIRAEGLVRIQALLPAIEDFKMLELLAAIYPGLNQAALGPEILRVRDIYAYGRGKIVQAKGATAAQLNAYDPATDAGWP